MSPHVYGMAEMIDYTFFDREPLTSPKTMLFQTPYGMHGKHSNETNMMMAGQLPPPQRFALNRIRAVLYHGDRNNLSLLPLSDPNWSRIRFDLVIGRKVYQGGVLMSVADPMHFMPSEKPEDHDSIRPKFAYPLYIESGEWMGVEVYTEAPAENLYIEFYLDGGLQRGVLERGPRLLR